jgi:hypothetical protein
VKAQLEIKRRILLRKKEERERKKKKERSDIFLIHLEYLS